MYDLAIVGSGFGGALTALIARRLGLTVILLERGSHPRFAIGESSTPLTNILIETLADEYDLPRLRPLSKYGTWKRTYPEVGVGLKRGFSFYHHQLGRPFAEQDDRSDQLLAAASPHEEIADTHWYRPDFDWFLVREAQTAGVDYVDRVALSTFERFGDRCVLSGERGGSSYSIDCRFTIDASGPNGFLSRALSLPHNSFSDYPATHGLFTHFRGVRLFADVHPPCDESNLPYPIDASALHHVFDGGWIWVLRFDNGITSAGVAATEEASARYRLSDGKPAWHRLLDVLPSVRDQFDGAEVVEEWRYSPRLPFRSDIVHGPGFALLPSAAAFIDPLFSTGFALTLLGIQRIASAIRDTWGTPEYESRIATHASATLAEADMAAELVGACYGLFDSFPLFTGLANFYLAAVSYAETCYRMGNPERASGFIAYKDSEFISGLRSCISEARRLRALGPEAETGAFVEMVARAIESRNIAGLANPARRNWYPVEIDDLVHNARKLGRSREEMEKYIHAKGLAKYR
jgi:FADH2 O2-dependent halogenase